MTQRSDELGPELKPCNHVRALGERRCLYCGAPLPLEYPTCVSSSREIELAFARYTRAAAALIERGECDA